jgi:hypothetical protein
MPTDNPQRTATGAARHHWSIPHIAAVAIGIAAYFGIYSITGDSDLFIALATGTAGGALTWGVLEVEFWFRNRTRA